MNATLTSGPDVQTGQSRSIWFVLLGIVMILSGIFALLAPLASSLAFTIVFGVATLTAGLAEIIHAFWTKSWRGFFINLLLGIAYAAFGAMVILNPLVGALALSMLIASFLVGIGIGEVVLGLRVRGERGWAWLVLSGLVTLVLGVWLLLRLPTAGLFMSGIFLGTALILHGLSFVTMGGPPGPVRPVGDAEPAA